MRLPRTNSGQRWIRDNRSLYRTGVFENESAAILSKALHMAAAMAYSQILTATGDTPITWSIESGSLPAGLSLSGNTISGASTTAETKTFTVKATNSAGSDTKSLNTDDHIAYMSGRGNDVFAPDENITRAEVAQMFYNMLREKNVTITKYFSDVPSDVWYAKTVNTLATLGIINGYPDGDFHPNNNITRVEFAVIAVKFAKISQGSMRFTDVTSSHWAYEAVNTAANFGWVSGVGGNHFKPNRNITRAGAATLFNRNSRYVLIPP